MRPIVTIHGIGAERDQSGYSDALRTQVARLARARDLGAPDWHEVVWSDLSDLGGIGLADMIADVWRYGHDPTLRAAIRARLVAALDAHPGAVLVAHSLGSVAAVDALVEDRHGVRALLTIGSPLALVGPGIDYRRRALSAGALSALPWVDVWSPGDPICTGAGLPATSGGRGLQSAGYPCISRELSGLPWLLAHVEYWASPFVARWLLQLASAPEEGS